MSTLRNEERNNSRLDNIVFNEYYYEYQDDFPICHDHEMQEFFNDLAILFAKADGKLPRKLVFQVHTRIFGGTIQEYRWNPQFMEPWITRVRNRLSTLRKYRINSKEKIRRLLLTSFQGEKNLRQRERQVLEALISFPDLTNVQHGEMLGLADTTIRYNLQKLERKIGLSVQTYTDIGKLKLRHYILFMRVPPNITRSQLQQYFDSKNRISLTSGFFGELADRGYWAWASFWIPNQRRCIAQYKKEIFKLKPLFEEFLFYEVTSKGSGVNLSFYDNKQWFFNEDVFAQGVLEFAREWGSTIPSVELFPYNQTPIKFDQIDYLLAMKKSQLFNTKLSEYQHTLTSFGFPLSLGAISLRLSRLNAEGLFKPFVAFQGLGLPNFLTALIECDRETQELLLIALSQFPRYYLSNLDDGLLIGLYLPDDVLTQFRYLFETLREDVDRMEIFYRYTNLGSASPLELYKAWNQSKNYWEYSSFSIHGNESK